MLPGQTALATDLLEAAGGFGGCGLGGFFFTVVLFGAADAAGLETGLEAGFDDGVVLVFGCGFGCGFGCTFDDGIVFAFGCGFDCAVDDGATLLIGCGLGFEADLLLLPLGGCFVVGGDLTVGVALLEVVVDNLDGPCFDSFGGLEVTAPLPTAVDPESMELIAVREVSDEIVGSVKTEPALLLVSFSRSSQKFDLRFKLPSVRADAVFCARAFCNLLWKVPSLAFPVTVLTGLDSALSKSSQNVP